jgi:VWFA-related protein
VTRDNSIRARQQLARFVETQLGPSDMISIMQPLDPLSVIRHTRNHSAIVRGIQEFTGRKYDYTPRNPSEDWMYLATAEQIERMRNDITFRALKALIVRMGGLKEGRKSLVLLSEGYSNTLPPQIRDQRASQPGIGNAVRDNPHAGDTGLEFRRNNFAEMDLAIYLREIYDLANRNNVSIYPVDPRGLAASEFGVDTFANISMKTDSQFLRTTMETLQVLAENSDGRAIINQNDPLPAMKQIVVDSSFYYLLGYSSTVSTPDGKYHEIDVKLKRPGLQVRHRRGYWALKPEESARLNAPVTPPPPNAVEVAMAANVTARNRPIRTWLGTAKGDGGRTKVTFVWEPVTRVAGQAVRESDRAARVTVTATGADGSPLFRGVAAPLTPTSPSAQVSFELPAGRVQLRLSVEGNAGVIDSEVRELTVPDLTAPRVVIGTPEVFRARTIPELQRLKQDPGAVPTASREFSRTDRLLIRVPAYTPGTSTPKVTARLLSRAGQAMADLPVALGSSPSASTIDLGLASLAAGDYGVEITATTEAGEAKEVIAFRVTN